MPELRAVFYGDGPERAVLDQAIRDHGLGGVVDARGFASSERVHADFRRALCVLLTSRREGYGMVVVEAAAAGTPSIVVAGTDNAAVELIEHGVNGLIADRACAEDLGAAIVKVAEAGRAMRIQTKAWFEQHLDVLSLEASLSAVASAYRAD
jgi:glycosyltransferase involved in cell wall biosynthesis